MRRPRNPPNLRARVRKQHKNRQRRRPTRGRATSATIRQHAVAAAPAKPAVAGKKRAVRKPLTPGNRPPRKRARHTARYRRLRADQGQRRGDRGLHTHHRRQQGQSRRVAPHAYYNRGNAHSAKGDFAAAIADYDEAIKLDPKNASALTNRGTAHSEKGDADAAFADFDEAIKRNPRYASAYFNRANAYAARADADRAIADYTSSIRYDRRNVNAYIARGALYLAGGAVPKARADMALAARLDRKNAYAVLWQDIAERRAKQKGVLTRGAEGARHESLARAGDPAVHGEIKQDAVLSAADDANPTVKQAHTCEANFYGGAVRADRGISATTP